MEKENNYGCYLFNTGTFNARGLSIYKIGKSSNIEKRIRSHRISNPVGLLVATFPLDASANYQNNRSKKLNKLERHIHSSLYSHAYDTIDGGVEFYCFDDDEMAINKVNEAIDCMEETENPRSRAQIHSSRQSPKADPTPKSRKKRQPSHSFQHINLVLQGVSREERAQVNKELNYWCCIEKRLVIPTKKTAIENDYEEVYKPVDEKGRCCWNKDGLPIPRSLRDEYMRAYYGETVMWYGEDQPDVLHDDLNENYQHYLKIRNRNLANAGLA